MIESLSAGLLGALRTGVSDAPTIGLGPVASLDVQRFRSAVMGAASAADTAPATLISTSATAAQGLAAQPAVSRASPASGAPTIGESILSGIKSVSEDSRERVKYITDVLNNPSPSVSDLMQLQFTMLQNSLQFELTSKLISKAPQTLDSILKAQ